MENYCDPIMAYVCGCNGIPDRCKYGVKQNPEEGYDEEERCAHYYEDNGHCYCPEAIREKKVSNEPKVEKKKTLF